MICSEGSQWQSFAVHCLPMWGTIGMSYLWEEPGKKEGEFICSLSPDLAELMMFSLLTRYRGRGWWLRGLLPVLVDLILFPSIFLPGDSLFAGTEECFMFAFTLACYTPRRCCSAGAVNRSGQQGANEMYHWPHNPAALNTLLCVYTRTLTSNTHWTPSLLQARVWNLEANTYHYLSQVPHNIKCVFMLDYISLLTECFPHK